MLKRTLALILVLLLCSAALSETAYEYVTQRGYVPATKPAQGREKVCYFEGKRDGATFLWTDGETQYRLETAGDPKALAGLYVELLSLTAWDRCQFISGGKRLYGFNAPKRARNSYATLAQYAEAIAGRLYGTTPVPTATPEPTLTLTPAPTPTPQTTPTPDLSRTDVQTYVLNTNTLRFHRPDCEHVREIYSRNRKDVHMSRQEILDMGYTPCKGCKP